MLKYTPQVTKRERWEMANRSRAKWGKPEPHYGKTEDMSAPLSFEEWERECQALSAEVVKNVNPPSAEF